MLTASFWSDDPCSELHIDQGCICLLGLELQIQKGAEDSEPGQVSNRAAQDCNRTCSSFVTLRCVVADQDLTAACKTLHLIAIYLHGAFDLLLQPHSGPN